MKRTGLAVLCAVIGCGGDDGDGLSPLEDDPATLTTCATQPPAAGSTRAKRVVCDDELLAGRMAAGRVGDLVIENSRVRAIIRGPGDGLYLFGTTGGALVDAAQHGRDDVLQEVLPLVELNTGQMTEFAVVEAGDDGAAEIAVRGPALPTPLFASALATAPANVIVELRYRLEPDDIALTIETRVYADPDAAGEPGSVVGAIDALFLGGRVTPLFPEQPSDSSQGAFLGSVGESTSYAVVLDPDVGRTMRLIELAFFELLELPAIEVDGDPQTRHLVIGDGSLSSVVDRAWSLAGETTQTVSGTTAAGVDVVARTPGDAVASIARSQADGSYSLELRPGPYTLTAEATDRTLGDPVAITVASAAVAQDVSAGPRGAIEVTATADGAATVARIVVSGAGLERTLYSDPSGATTVGVPPGTYTVSVSKGMEYDAFTATDVVVADDGQTPLAAALTRVLATDGWISLDPHLHSEMSIDSSVPLETRLLSVAGEGVEVAVSSDHDFVVDYGPVISDLGLSAEVAAMSGQESSSLIIGHVNAWPTPPDPDRPGGGAIAWYDSGPSTVFELARMGDPSRIVQVNHPWDSLGLFTAIDFDRATLMARRSGADLGIPGVDLTDLSFDALEVGNKKTEDAFDQAFGDWLALVSAGFPIAATGASDSHGDDAFAGEARTFVFVGAGADDPGSIDPAVINDAIRNQRAVVAQGIFVSAGLVVGANPASLPGDLVDPGAATDVTLRIEVQAPPWLPVSAVVIYERDVEIMRIPIDPGDTQVIRYAADMVLPLGNADTLFVVVAEAGGDGAPVMEQPKPSFTNPLYVDVDGNGSYDP